MNELYLASSIRTMDFTFHRFSRYHDLYDREAQRRGAGRVGLHPHARPLLLLHCQAHYSKLVYYTTRRYQAAAERRNSLPGSARRHETRQQGRVLPPRPLRL